jgi:PhnB protein
LLDGSGERVQGSAVRARIYARLTAQMPRRQRRGINSQAKPDVYNWSIANAMKLYTYLNFGGNCREAFQFYEQHLGGKIETMLTRGQQLEGTDIPPDQRETILFARMRIGETELMGADVPQGFERMRSAYLYLSAESPEEADGAWAVLVEGAQVIVPIAETFFAIRFGMLRDRFGTLWMIIRERG